MKNIRKIISRLLLIVIVSLIAPVSHAHAFAPDFQKSATVIPHSATDLSSDTFKQSMRELAATHANRVTFVLLFYQTSFVQPDIFVNSNNPTDASLIDGINYAHSLGLQVGFKPHIDISDPIHGDWRESINPADRNAWFANYDAILLHYAKIAQQQNVQYISIGTELIDLTDPRVNATNTSYWVDLIQKMRAVYSGKLTYTAHFQEWPNIQFWPQLDYIGIGAYFALSDTANPSLDQVLGRWDQIVPSLQTFSQTIGKPVVFSEIGYRSVLGASREPWGGQSMGDIVDTSEQQTLYQALFQEWNSKPWMVGIDLWGWDTNPATGGPTDTNFTPQHKPAEQVITDWFGKTATTPPVQTQNTPWKIYGNAPIMLPQGGMDDGDNIYAPDVHLENGVWKMWYGGQGTDGHDRILYATSSDGLHWTKQGVAVDVFPTNHVNDPSVVNVNGAYYMYFTDNDFTKDRIALATSPDGLHWTKKGTVMDITPGTWEHVQVGRPSVIFENGVFKMWYDAQNADGSRAIGYATSTDGVTWQKYAQNPVLKGIVGAPDVKHIGSNYVLVYEGGDGTHWAIGTSETNFTDQGLLFGLSGGVNDQFGQPTPMVFVQNGHWMRTYFGGASNPCWCQNRIFVAQPNFGNENNTIYSIQGLKVLQSGGDASLANQPVTLDGAQTQTTNPYTFTSIPLSPGGKHTVSVPQVPGYTVGYTLCYDRTNCHMDTPIPGNSVTISDDLVAFAGGYADLWWHYTLGAVTTPTPTLTPTPTAIPTPTPIPDIRLGGMNLDGYCQNTGQTGASLVNNAWTCVPNNATITLDTACVWQYGAGTFTKQERTNDPYSYACYGKQNTAPPSRTGGTTVTATPAPLPTSRPNPTIAITATPNPIPGGRTGTTASATATPTPTPVRLGGMDLDTFCKASGQTGAALTNNTWNCVPSNTAINLDQVCQKQYNTPTAKAKQERAGDPYSLACYQ